MLLHPTDTPEQSSLSPFSAAPAGEQTSRRAPLEGTAPFNVPACSAKMVCSTASIPGECPVMTTLLPALCVTLAACGAWMSWRVQHAACAVVLVSRRR
jgi:hypothetical protein